MSLLLRWRVRRAIRQVLPDAAITFTPFDTTGMIVTAIVSTGFEGLQEHQRQELVWGRLNVSLTQKQRTHLSAILTLTPAQGQSEDLSSFISGALVFRRRLSNTGLSDRSYRSHPPPGN